MALTTQERDNIVKLAVGMFNAAPGSTYLQEFTAFFEANGRSLSSLANYFAGSSAYKGIYPNFQSAAEFASTFLTPLGLQANTVATDFVTSRFNKGQSTQSIMLDTLIALDATTDSAFTTAKAILNNKTSVATTYSLTNSALTLSALQAVVSSVDATAASVTAANAANSSASGNTFTLTTGVDTSGTMIGSLGTTSTAGNDIFIADNSGTVNLTTSAADTINGGAGNDTLKIYTTGATAITMPTLTSIETLYIHGGALTAFDASTAAIKTTGGVSTLSIDSASANVAATYTLSSQDLVLANKTSTAATTTTIASSSTSTHTSHNVTLNAITRDAAANATTLDFTGARVTTLNLTTTGVASNVLLANTTGAAITTINVAGTVGLTFATSAAMSGAVTSVNASTATGAVSADMKAALTGAAFTFTGGSGNDTVTFINDEFGALTAGSQLNGGTGTDKIGLFDTAVSAAEAAKINAAVSFETIGLNAAITLDATSLTIKNYSIDTTTLTQSITGLASGSAVTITVAAPTSLTLSGDIGVTSTTVNLGSSTTTGVTVGTLVVTGLTTVAISSNGTAANTITTLTNSDNSTFTITGSQALTMTLSAGTTIGSSINGSAATGVLTLGGSTVIASGDVLVGGSGNDRITGGSGADRMTGGAGADTFIFDGTAAANANGTTFGTNFDEITDFVIGTDKIQITNRTEVVSTEQTAVAAAVAALAAGSTATQIATAMATASTTNLGVSFATFGGSTYVLFEALGAGVGVIANDIFIKLTGVTSLPSLSIDFTA